RARNRIPDAGVPRYQCHDLVAVGRPGDTIAVPEITRDSGVTFDSPDFLPRIPLEDAHLLPIAGSGERGTIPRPGKTGSRGVLAPARRDPRLTQGVPRCGIEQVDTTWIPK